MDSDRAHNKHDLPEPLTALQKKMYDQAEERYRARHFATPTVEIVPTIDQHFEPIKGILLRAYEPVAPDLYTSGYDKVLTDLTGRAATSIMFTALLNGHVAGSVTYIDDSKLTLHLFKDMTAGYIRFLSVDPSAHRLGIGRQLVTQCVEQAKILDRPAVGLHTTPMMAPATALYRSLGFVRSPDNDGVCGYSGQAPAYIRTFA